MSTVLSAEAKEADVTQAAALIREEVAGGVRNLSERVGGQSKLSSSLSKLQGSQAVGALYAELYPVDGADAQRWLAYAYACSLLGDYPLAADAWRTVLKLKPNWNKARNFLMEALLQETQYEEALSILYDPGLSVQRFYRYVDMLSSQDIADFEVYLNLIEQVQEAAEESGFSGSEMENVQRMLLKKLAAPWAYGSGRDRMPGLLGPEENGVFVDGIDFSTTPRLEQIQERRRRLYLHILTSEYSARVLGRKGLDLLAAYFTHTELPLSPEYLFPFIETYLRTGRIDDRSYTQRGSPFECPMAYYLAELQRGNRLDEAETLLAGMDPESEAGYCIRKILELHAAPSPQEYEALLDDLFSGEFPADYDIIDSIFGPTIQSDEDRLLMIAPLLFQFNHHESRSVDLSERVVQKAEQWASSGHYETAHQWVRGWVAFNRDEDNPIDEVTLYRRFLAQVFTPEERRIFEEAPLASLSELEHSWLTRKLRAVIPIFLSKDVPEALFPSNVEWMGRYVSKTDGDPRCLKLLSDYRAKSQGDAPEIRSDETAESESQSIMENRSFSKSVSVSEVRDDEDVLNPAEMDIDELVAYVEQEDVTGLPIVSLLNIIEQISAQEPGEARERRVSQLIALVNDDVFVGVSASRVFKKLVPFAADFGRPADVLSLLKRGNCPREYAAYVWALNLGLDSFVEQHLPAHLLELNFRNFGSKKGVSSEVPERYDRMLSHISDDQKRWAAAVVLAMIPVEGKIDKERLSRALDESDAGLTSESLMRWMLGLHDQLWMRGYIERNEYVLDSIVLRLSAPLDPISTVFLGIREQRFAGVFSDVIDEDYYYRSNMWPDSKIFYRSITLLAKEHNDERLQGVLQPIAETLSGFPLHTAMSEAAWAFCAGLDMKSDDDWLWLQQLFRNEKYPLEFRVSVSGCLLLKKGELKSALLSDSDLLSWVVEGLGRMDPSFKLIFLKDHLFRVIEYVCASPGEEQTRLIRDLLHLWEDERLLEYASDDQYVRLAERSVELGETALAEQFLERIGQEPQAYATALRLGMDHFVVEHLSENVTRVGTFGSAWNGSAFKDEKTGVDAAAPARYDALLEQVEDVEVRAAMRLFLSRLPVQQGEVLVFNLESFLHVSDEVTPLLESPDLIAWAFCFVGLCCSSESEPDVLSTLSARYGESVELEAMLLRATGWGYVAYRHYVQTLFENEDWNRIEPLLRELIDVENSAALALPERNETYREDYRRRLLEGLFEWARSCTNPDIVQLGAEAEQHIERVNAELPRYR
ncbi:MAG: hypothetical protein JXR40_07080 [Pontiellaceae bacterium]|nr:hypothetical protein [Pontiellaceae bacterium]